MSVKKTDAPPVRYCAGRADGDQEHELPPGSGAALEYEIRRQTAVLAEGGTLERETRTGTTGRGHHLHEKQEAANDYRYFPDPDIPPIVVTEELLESTRNSLPELPWGKERRFGEEYGLPEADAAFMAEVSRGPVLRGCVKSGASPLRGPTGSAPRSSG